MEGGVSSAEQTTARNKKKNRGRRAQTEDFSNSGEDGDSASSEGKASTKHNKYFKIFGMGLIFSYSVNPNNPGRCAKRMHT